MRRPPFSVFGSGSPPGPGGSVSVGFWEGPSMEPFLGGGIARGLHPPIERPPTRWQDPRVRAPIRHDPLPPSNTSEVWGGTMRGTKGGGGVWRGLGGGGGVPTVRQPTRVFPPVLRLYAFGRLDVDPAAPSQHLWEGGGGRMQVGPLWDTWGRPCVLRRWTHGPWARVGALCSSDDPCPHTRPPHPRRSAMSPPTTSPRSRPHLHVPLDSSVRGQWNNGPNDRPDVIPQTGTLHL